MSAADAIARGSEPRPARASAATRIVIYGLLIFFALVYLLPLVVMVMTSLKPLDEVTGGNMFALPHALTFDALGESLGQRLRRRLDLRRHQGLFLELDQDGGAGRR